MLSRFKMLVDNWEKLMCKRSELQLIGTLNGGQSFRWKNKFDDKLEEDVWIGVFGGCLWQLIQKDEYILYKVIEKQDSVDETASKKQKVDYEKLLSDYFRLSLNLGEYYKQWSDADPYFKEASEKFYGIRILAQDPVENLFSFICSSNNNISRISGMIEKMCALYGEKICELNNECYYTFPVVEKLADNGVEKALKAIGYGYRARYISKSAKTIMFNGGSKWFEELKSMDYPNAKKSLMGLMGVGAKVADCVCLMSLNHLQALPVDTHVYQIASKIYLKHLQKKKTITPAIYDEIGDHFRKLYGPLAGWAHTVLFCADLKTFQKTQDNSEDKPGDE